MSPVQQLFCDHEATLPTKPRAQSVSVTAVQASHFLNTPQRALVHMRPRGVSCLDL